MEVSDGAVIVAGENRNRGFRRPVTAGGEWFGASTEEAWRRFQESRLASGRAQFIKGRR